MSRSRHASCIFETCACLTFLSGCSAWIPTALIKILEAATTAKLPEISCEVVRKTAWPVALGAADFNGIRSTEASDGSQRIFRSGLNISPASGLEALSEISATIKWIPPSRSTNRIPVLASEKSSFEAKPAGLV